MGPGTGDAACSRPSSPLRPLAALLSWAGHPFLLVPVTVFAISRSLRWTAVVAATTTLPMLAVIVRKVRRGDWSDHDVSRHEQRSGLYVAAAPLVVLAAILLYILNAPELMLRGFLSGCAMLALGFAANGYLKVSLHMMFVGFAGVIVARHYPITIAAIIVFVAALAWSRRYLDRHTWPEIVVGLVTGVLAGLFTIV